MNKWIDDAVSFCLKQGQHSERDLRNHLMGSIPFEVDDTLGAKLEHAVNEAAARMSEARAQVIQEDTATMVEEVVVQKKKKIGRPRTKNPEKNIPTSPSIIESTEEVVTVETPPVATTIETIKEPPVMDAEAPVAEEVVAGASAITESDETIEQELGTDAELANEGLEVEESLDDEDESPETVAPRGFNENSVHWEDLQSEAELEQLADRLSANEEYTADPDRDDLDILWHSALGRTGPDTIDQNSENLEPIDEIEIKLASRPTESKPGSEEKVRVLEYRYKHGLPLWNAEDNYDHLPAGERNDDYEEFYYEKRIQG